MTKEKQTKDVRQGFLEEVAKIVCSDRASTHGGPEDNFTNIAKMWSVFKRVQFTTRDVAAMMVMVKLSRIIHNPNHRDSWLDIAGYAACTESLEKQDEF